MIVIIGAGITGATIAERYASDGYKVLIIDKRDHIAGNIYDEIDKETNIRINKYGAHIFHTNDTEVWEYVQRFGPWQRWDHKVVVDVSGVYAPLPVNITTVNTLCGESISSEEEMKEWLQKVQEPCKTPKNSEEVALSRVGKELYEKLFHQYTIKQWAKEPSELEPSVLERIPVRTGFDERYFSDRYQGLPVHGYTSIVQNMLSHPNITIRLNTSWEDIRDTVSDSTVIFTGPIDKYFKKTTLRPLEYRSINFEWTRVKTNGYLQPNSVVNFPLVNTPYTRCIEYKHFLHQQSEWSIICKETTSDSGEPYYPVPTQQNRALYADYVKLCEEEQNIHFIGRLATYMYLNMDQAIRIALDYYKKHLSPVRHQDS